jgi:hypothetical protein
LRRLIEDEGFPEGVLLGKNTRAWRLHEVTAWLKSRPTGPKIVNVEKARETRVRKALKAAAAEITT